MFKVYIRHFLAPKRQSDLSPLVETEELINPWYSSLERMKTLIRDIRHFLAPKRQSDLSPLVETEELMYEIPGDYPEDEILIDPKVKNEMGKAGSFEFAMEQNNPWYSSLEQMKTLIRVKYDNETIFYGRVLAIDTDMWGKRQVHCEGALAFLLDTLIEATKEDNREKISLAQYVKDLIDSHNRFVADEPNKSFSYGQIPGYYSESTPAEMRPANSENPADSEKRKFGTGSWTSTMNCLEDLTSKYGGYWRARYNDNNGKLYLDWLCNYFSPELLNQPLELTENIIDINNTVDVNGIFTVLIPEGSKNGESLYLDDVPKSIIKIPLQKTPKTPKGPGFHPWKDGEGNKPYTPEPQ